MDLDRIKMLENQLEKQELKLQAIVKALGVELEYTPQSYECVKPQEGE